MSLQIILYFHILLYRIVGRTFQTEFHFKIAVLTSEMTNFLL